MQMGGGATDFSLRGLRLARVSVPAFRGTVPALVPWRYPLSVTHGVGQSGPELLGELQLLFYIGRLKIVERKRKYK